MSATRRWSDNEVRLWRFTYSRDKGYKPLSIIVDSGEEEYPGCSLRLRGFGHTFIVELPPVIKPYRRWQTFRHIANEGGYWDVHRREYGFSLSEGFLHLSLGAQTGDSSTTQDWAYHLPWMQWRFHRFSLYGLAGEHVWTQLESTKIRGIDNYAAQRNAEESCPSASFTFDDYDGELITVRTQIHEREWHFGEKWCSWLSWFRTPKISRSLNLDFSKEVGREKGSWKGGTIGHSIEMLPGELHEAAFRRYCAMEHRSKSGPFRLKFVANV